MASSGEWRRQMCFPPRLSRAHLCISPLSSTLLLFREVGPCSQCRFGRYFPSKRRHHCTATPWPPRLVLLSKADPKTSSGADKLQISLCHTAVLLQQKCKFISPVGCFSTCAATVRAAELWCLHEPSWELRRGWAPGNAEPGFPPISGMCCWDPASPRGRKTLSCCYESHLRTGLFHCQIVTALTCFGASRLSAKLVNQGMLNCQVHHTSKERKLFPWNSFCSLATETFHQSFPLKRQAVRCSRIPSSSSPQPSRALSPLQYKPKCLKRIVKNPLQTQ